MVDATSGGAFFEPPLRCPVSVVGNRTFDFRRSIALMAVVNRTRDSFYDRGRTFALERAVDAATTAIAAGADWLDFGAVPFSPLAEEVSPAEEIERLVPLIRNVRSRTDAVISVDTFRAEVADAVLEAGADAINDTSGFHDQRMPDVIAAHDAAVIVCHSKAAPREWYPTPHYDDLVGEVVGFLDARARVAESAGVQPAKIFVDPGHDLNKNTVHSLELTRRLSEFCALGRPLLASVSNKDFIQETLGRPRDAVLIGTVATVVMCVLNGARVVRVHDVADIRAALTMVEAAWGWRQPASLRHNVAEPPGP